MTWWLRQLCAPLNYLRIRIHPNGKPFKGKFIYDVTLPLSFAFMTTVFFFLFKDQISVTGKEGMMSDVKSLLQLLIAFFIAALAAVSTFQNEYMQEDLSGQPAKLNAWSVDDECFKDFILSRRQFVCYLFGYLSFISIFIFILISLSQGFSDEVRIFLENLETKLNCNYLVTTIRTAGVFIYSSILGNLLSTTLLGLYFLTSGFHKLE